MKAEFYQGKNSDGRQQNSIAITITEFASEDEVNMLVDNLNAYNDYFIAEGDNDSVVIIGNNMLVRTAKEDYKMSINNIKESK